MSDKCISGASFECNSRIPKPVSGVKSKAKKQDYSTTRSLRSNTRSTPASRPIQINRDCLKVIPVANNRVVKRTRPLIRRGKSIESASTSQTSVKKPRAPGLSAIKSRSLVHSAIKSRVPVARITSPSFVKPAISTTTTQISSRVLRSHGLSKILSSVQSSKTDSCSAAKISTVNNLNAATSSRILRSHVSSPQEAGNSSTRSNIPRLSWNLRSRSSVPKAEGQKKKDYEETRPLGKRIIFKQVEHTTHGKRVALSEKPHADVRNLHKKPRNDLEVNASRSEELQRKVEVKLTKTQKAVDLKLTKSIPADAEISAVFQSKSLSSSACERIVDVSSREKSLATSVHDIAGEPSMVEEQSVKTSHEAPGCQTRQVLPAKLCEERSLTSANSEIKILDKDIDTSQGIPSHSARVHEVVESTLEAKLLVQESHFETQSATLEVEIPVKVRRGNASSDKKNIASVRKSTNNENIEGGVEPFFSTKVQLVSDEKPAVLTDIPIVPKRKREETSTSDDVSSVKNRLDVEIAEKRAEVFKQSDGPSTVNSPEASRDLEETQTISTVSFKTFTQGLEALKQEKFSESLHAEPPSVSKLEDEGFEDNTTVLAPPALQSIIETTKTSEVNTSCPSELTVAVKADSFPVTTNAEISAVREEITEEHFDSVVISTCYEPTIVVPGRLHGAKNALTTVVLHEKTRLVNTSSPVEIVAKSWFKSSKRQASLTPIDNHCIVKKRRNVSSERYGNESSCFSSPIQSCLSQTMEIESPLSVVSNICMDVDPTVSNFVFEHNPSATQNTQSGINDSDMELSESSQTLPFTFGNIQQQARPTVGGFSFAATGQQAGQSFGFNKPQNGSIFHCKPVVDGSRFNNVAFGNGPHFSGFPSGAFNLTSLPASGLNQTGNRIFGVQPQQDSRPMSGLNQTNSFQIFDNPLQALRIRPTFVNSDGSPRKFFSTKGYRRRNAAKVRFHPNQTSAPLPLVFANGFQTGLDFSMVAQSPTPMESEDISTSDGNGGQQMFKQYSCSNQTISGQNINNNLMEERLQSPSLMICDSTLPQPRSTVSCFDISQQTRATAERKLSLPEMVLTSPIVVPTSPFLLQPARLKLPSSSANYVNLTRNTNETSIFRANTLSEHRFKMNEQPSFSVGVNQEIDETLNIYSSISSLVSSNSSLNDCRSDIDVSDDNDSESVSNCSLDDSTTTMDDIGELIEMFKTLTVALK